MRVFVPGASGGAQALFALAAARAACRCATCGRACRRSRTCSPGRSGKSRRSTRLRPDARFTIRSYRRYAGDAARARAASAWLVIAARRHPVDHRASARSSACCCSPGCRSSSARCRSTSPRTSRRRRSWRRRRETFREFLEQQALFVFFITIWVGAGLIANDRRANALQIYLSKPLTRGRVHRRQAGDPGRCSCCSSPGCRPCCCCCCRCSSPAASRSSGATCSCSRPSRCSRSCRCCWSSFTMLALSSLSKSSRFVAIIYAGVDLLHRGAVYGVLRGVTGNTVVLVAVVRRPTSTSSATSIFRLPPRYRHALAGLAADGRSA